MATEKRLIDANKISYHKSGFPKGDGFDSGLDWAYREDIEKLPTVDAVVLPCKIGDRAWVIRCYRGVKHPQEGIVNEMFFNEQMELCIVVKNIARGIWGKAVFGSYEDAQAAISRERKYNG